MAQLHAQSWTQLTVAATIWAVASHPGAAINGKRPFCSPSELVGTSSNLCLWRLCRCSPCCGAGEYSSHCRALASSSPTTTSVWLLVAFSNLSLTLYPLGTDTGWFVLALTLLIASWKARSEPTGNTAVDHRDLRYVRAVSIGVALVALGWQISTILIGNDEFIRRIGPILIPTGYLVIALTLWRLAVRSASHSAQGDSSNSPLKATQLLLAAGLGVALEAVAYVPALRGSSSWLGIASFCSACPVGIGVLGVGLLVAAKRGMAPSAPLAVLGVGLLVVIMGMGLIEAAELAVPGQWRWPISLGSFSTGTGYVILALTAAYSAPRTGRRTFSRRRDPYDGSPVVEPQGLWVS